MAGQTSSITAVARPVLPLSFDVRRLPALRRQVGLTQQQAADRLGVPVENVSRMERALRPGGLVEQMVDLLTEVAEESETP